MPWLSTPCRSAQERTSAVVSALASGMPQASKIAFNCARCFSYGAGTDVSFARRVPSGNAPARGSGCGDAVNARRGAAVERGLFGGRGAGGDPLERIPQFGVAARLLVRREITLEHAAVDAKSFDARLDVLAP